ncbi:MAG TPA: class III lanthionine synthetase LanKC [Longimicrobium sp.]|nr:class III lanthionine synthetase LanKC [Longimicrobium sp.]
MRELNSFVYVDPEHFESLGRLRIRPDYLDRLRLLLPESWRLFRQDIWLMAECPDVELPVQGFKIHVSGTLANAEQVLDRVVPACVAARAQFKAVADPMLLSVVGSKNYGRGSSSKFLTIYPSTAESFVPLMQALHEATRDLESAYILSDRRFEESQLVFYRYGGIRLMYELDITGSRDPVILAPDGSRVPDPRGPVFQLPPWVTDPLGEPRDEAQDGPVVLNGRYEVQEALSHSNVGGVYRALDRQTGRRVVLKEARPQTALWRSGDGFVDAVAVLRREHDLLQRLAHLPFVPAVLDLFQEWEHTFLVEEMVEGVPLTRFRARENVILIPFDGSRYRARRFCLRFHPIATGLLDAVLALHHEGVIFGDLSPSNVLVDPATTSVRLIDFESAYVRDGSESGEFSSVWATPGFKAPGRTRRGTLAPSDDFYALGMLLYSMLLPMQSLFEVAPASKLPFLRRLCDAARLPPQVEGVITALLDDRPGDARALLAGWDPAVVPAAPRRTVARGERTALVASLPALTAGMARHMVATADPARADRLWPADYTVFMSNPLSLAYGACGTALFLLDEAGGLPPELEAWILERPLSTTLYPPGLYTGLAGVAWTLEELGHPERAREVFAMACESPMRLADPTLFQGAAGWGMTGLMLHERSGDRGPLEAAREAGEHLLACAAESDEGLSWTNALDGEVRHGMAYGASGIGLFLLRLHQATGEGRWVEAARRAMDFEVAHARTPRGRLKWGRNPGSRLVEPYWLHGGAGIGAALVRFHQVLGDPGYLALAERAADTAFTRYTVAPGVLEGLSGIGELLLDLHAATGEPRHRRRAADIAASVLGYAVEKPTGIAFPGRHLLRLSADYGHGAAGIGLFLRRLARPGPRRFHDLTTHTEVPCRSAV